MYTSAISGYGSVTVTGSGTGILCVAETIEHELHHLDIYSNFHEIGNDPDADGIPSSVEGSLDGMSTHLNNPDTYNMRGNYSSYGDNEIRCRKIELNHTVQIFPNLDWSNPGCQHKNRFGPPIQQ